MSLSNLFKTDPAQKTALLEMELDSITSILTEQFSRLSNLLNVCRTQEEEIDAEVVALNARREHIGKLAEHIDGFLSGLWSAIAGEYGERTHHE